MDRIELFKAVSPTIKVSMQLYFNEKGQLIFDGYDSGKGVEDCWGDSDYEYSYTIEPSNVKKFYPILGVPKGDRAALLLELKKRFGTNTAYTDLGKFMTANHIKYEPFTWT